MAMTSNQVGIKQVGVPSDDEPYVVPITAYGATYSGFGQAGLPSEQYPNIPPAAGPIANAGISQVGTWADGVLVNEYMVRGNIMQYGRWYYQCKSIRSLTYRAFTQLTGTVYTPTISMVLFAIGTKVAVANKVYRLIGKLAVTQVSVYKLKASLVGFMSQVITTKGILYGNFDICWPVNGVISPLRKYVLQVKGNLQAIVIATYAVWGRMLAVAGDAYLVISHIGNSSKKMLKITGTLKVKAQKMLKIIGTMQTDIETRLLQITGKISVPQFIAAVPRRLQDWVTNKTWWR